MGHSYILSYVAYTSEPRCVITSIGVKFEFMQIIEYDFELFPFNQGTSHL